MEELQEPSVAVIVLPSQLPSTLPKHSLYLPLINRPSFDLGTALPTLSSAFSVRVVSDSAHYAWERVGLPLEKTLLLDAERPDTVVDEADLELMDHTALSKAFASLIWGKKEDKRKFDVDFNALSGW